VWLDSAGQPLHGAGPGQALPITGGCGGMTPLHLALQPDGKVWVWPILQLEGVALPGVARLFPPGIQTGARLEMGSGLIPEGAGLVSVRVQRLGDISAPLTARLLTRSDTATAGADFAAMEVLLQFAPMETTKTVEIQIFDDLLAEPDETFRLQLIDARTGQEIAGGESTVVILDNDRRGSIDVGFSSPFQTSRPDGSSTYISSLREQSGNRLMVGGDLYLQSEPTYRRLARLLPDGAVDPTFVPERSGWGFLVLPDDRLMVWGDVNPPLTRLLPEGALDSGFQLESSRWENRWLSAIEAQPDGKVLVSGGDSANNNTGFIRRLLPNGSLDALFSEVRLENNQSSRLLLLRDGRVLLYGNFTSIRGTARPGLAALKADGTLDNAFAPLLSNPGINAAVETSDGKILVAGSLSIINGTNVLWSIARFLPDGRLDPTFVGGPGARDTFGNLFSVLALTVLSDGGILVGGDFTTFHGERRSTLAFLRADGTLDPWADTGVNFRSVNPWGGSPGSVSSLLPLSDGRIAVGGYFNRVSSAAGSGELVVPGLILLNGPVPVRFHDLEVLRDGTFRFSLQVEPGGNYVLESSDDLRQWTPVLTNRAFERVLVFDDLEAQGTTQRFFRAIRQ